MTPVIETSGLTKRYREVPAVDHLDLTVFPGEIFGLLGPNGAGKTTTILMLLGLTEPSQGMARVLGYDPAREALAVKRRVGYLPENVGFYDDLTGRENLTYTARLNRMEPKAAAERISMLLDRVGLTAAADRRVREFSRGMRQRLGIADALVKEPQVLILDEPTLAIDPKGVQEVLELISSLARDEGLTVLISSHLLYQIQQICHRVGIFVRGRLVAQGPISNLAQQALAHRALVLEVQTDASASGPASRPADGPQVETLLRGLPGVEAVEKQGEYWLVHCRPGSDPRTQLVRELTARGVGLLHLRARGQSLDDIYREYFQGGETR